MRSSSMTMVALVLAVGSTASAATFRFDSDPFAGSTALTTPGRQVVGGEPSITFNVGSDVFSFDPAFFNAGNQVNFANDEVGNLPTSDVNVVVLRTFDNDANPATAFGAGNAANLIAAQLTSPGAGFFIYFNSGLDLARLVYSTDLDDATADLKILARMTNLAGQAGRDAFPTFTAANFAIEPVPEPSSLVLLASAGAAWAGRRAWRRKGARP